MRTSASRGRKAAGPRPECRLPRRRGTRPAAERLPRTAKEANRPSTGSKGAGSLVRNPPMARTYTSPTMRCTTLPGSMPPPGCTGLDAGKVQRTRAVPLRRSSTRRTVGAAAPGLHRLPWLEAVAGAGPSAWRADSQRHGARASTSPSTRRAPASDRRRATASSCEPVVQTSSRTRTTFPATRSGRRTSRTS